MSTVFLFQTSDLIQLTWEIDTVRNINLPMIQYNTKIYKGVTNSLDFQVKNNDRKAINLAGLTLTVRINNVETSDVLLTKAAQLTDEPNGRAQLILTPTEISEWPAGFYTYNVETTDTSGISRFLCVDLNRSITGNFELIDTIGNILVPATTIKGSQFTPQPIGSYSSIWSSTAFPGNAQLGLLNGMHTCVVYQTNWTGKFWIQTSLNNDPPRDYEWSNSTIGTSGEDYYLFTNSTPTICYFNIVISCNWIRFRFLPDSLNQGTFDQVSYKC